MLNRSLESLVAGVCVYAAMAACSGGGAASRSPGDGDAGGAVASEGGQPSKGGAPSTAEAGDAMADSPVPNAMAAGNGGDEGECGCQPAEPREPTVVEAECGETVSGSPSVWAIAEFPGKTAIELARVVALVENPPDLNKWPAGFQHHLGAVIVKDGAAAVTCGSAASPATQALSVTFVLP